MSVTVQWCGGSGAERRGQCGSWPVLHDRGEDEGGQLQPQLRRGAVDHLDEVAQRQQEQEHPGALLSPGVADDSDQLCDDDGHHVCHDLPAGAQVHVV